MEPTGIESELKEVGRGAVITLAGKFSWGVLHYGAFVLMGRGLGAAGLGDFSTGMTLISALAIVSCFGMNGSLVRFGSRYVAEGDTGRLKGLFAGAFGLVAVISTVVAVVAYALSPWLLERTSRDASLVWLPRMFAVTLPWFSLMMLTWFGLLGMRAAGARALSEGFVRPGLMFMLVLVFTGGGLRLGECVTAFQVSVGAALVVGAWFLWRSAPGLRAPGPAVFDARATLRYSAPMFLSEVIGSFAGWADTFMLWTMSGADQIGVYNAAARNAGIGSLVYGSFLMLFAPVLSALFASGEEVKLRALIKTVTRWGLTASLPMYLLMCLFSREVMGIFGDGFEGGGTVLTLLAVGSVVNAATGPVMLVMALAGRQNTVLLNVIVVAATKTGLNLLLIPRYGAEGAASATIVCGLLSNGMLLMWVYRSLRTHPFSLGWLAPFAAGAAGAGAALLLRGVIAGETLGFVLGVVGFLAVYAGVIAAVGIREEDRAVIEPALRRLGLRKAGGKRISNIEQ